MFMTDTPAIKQPPTLSAAVVLHHSPLEQLHGLLVSLDKSARALGVRIPLYLIDQSQSAAYSEAVQTMTREVATITSLQLQLRLHSSVM